MLFFFSLDLHLRGQIIQPSIQPEILLEGAWKFRPKDDESWKEVDYDDQGWADIEVPAKWETEGYARYDGYGWYRKKVEIPDSLAGQQLILLLGKIDDVDQLYINGQLVGALGFVDQEPKVRGNEWLENRGYFIPHEILAPSRRLLIAVRVFDQGGDGGIYEGPVGIISQRRYIQYWKNRSRHD